MTLLMSIGVVTLILGFVSQAQSQRVDGHWASKVMLEQECQAIPVMGAPQVKPNWITPMG